MCRGGSYNRVSEMSLQLKTVVENKGWETSDFPIICESCMGDNPFMRMMRDRRACHICNRPYSAFHYKAGRQGRFKVTVTCQTCARLKNIC